MNFTLNVIFVGYQEAIGFRVAEGLQGRMRTHQVAAKSFSTKVKFAGTADSHGGRRRPTKGRTAMAAIGKDAPHLAFAKRLAQAIDGMAYEVPDLQHGRLRWFQDKMEAATGDRPSHEAVRRWLAGVTIPKQATLNKLAEVMQVDAGWLMFGAAPQVSAHDRKVRSAEVHGVVNVLAGVIEMDGGHPAFPEGGEDTLADIYAIIRGARYSFKVTLGEALENGSHRFMLPPKTDGLIVIGVVRTQPHSFAFYELDPESVERDGKRQGAMIGVTSNLSSLRRIETFGQRL